MPPKESVPNDDGTGVKEPQSQTPTPEPLGDDGTVQISAKELNALKSEITNNANMTAKMNETMQLINEERTRLGKAASFVEAASVLGIDPDEVIQQASLRKQKAEDDDFKLDLPQYENEDEAAPFLKPVRGSLNKVSERIKTNEKYLKQLEKQNANSTMVISYLYNESVKHTFAAKNNIPLTTVTEYAKYAEDNGLGEYINTPTGRKLVFTEEGLGKAREGLSMDEVHKGATKGDNRAVLAFLDSAGYELEGEIRPKSAPKLSGGKKMEFDSAGYDKVMKQGHNMTPEELNSLLGWG